MPTQPAQPHCGLHGAGLPGWPPQSLFQARAFELMGLLFPEGSGQTLSYLLHMVEPNQVGSVPCAHLTDEQTEAQRGFSDTQVSSKEVGAGERTRSC